jgi:OOP family OmpA-OmpF porin
MRLAGFVIAASLLAAGPLAAQEKGTFELGGFARYTGYQNKSYEVQGPDDNRVGFGGRLGYFVADNFAIEFDGSFNPTDLRPGQPNVPSTVNPNARSRPMTYVPMSLYGIYNPALGESVSLLMGAGPTYGKLGKGIDWDGFGVGAIAGLRLKPASFLNLRLEGTMEYFPSGYGDGSDVYYGAQAGVSFLLGGGCDHSLDMIGIQPSSATLQPGQSQTFTSDASYCGNPDAVVFRLSGPGTLDSLTGRYTATTEGCGTVSAHSAKGKLMSSAQVCTRAAAPPPPPPVAPQPVAPPVTPQRPTQTFEMQMVHFRFDRSDLTQGAMDTLNAVANTLKANAAINVDVVGHTDWIGTNAYNMRLSEARAATVRAYLIQQGIAEGRITVRWRGEEEPIADNETTAGRALNRRGEVKQNN